MCHKYRVSHTFAKYELLFEGFGGLHPFAEYEIGLEFFLL